MQAGVRSIDPLNRRIAFAGSCRSINSSYPRMNSVWPASAGKAFVTPFFSCGPRMLASAAIGSWSSPSLGLHKTISILPAPLSGRNQKCLESCPPRRGLGNLGLKLPFRVRFHDSLVFGHSIRRHFNTGAAKGLSLQRQHPTGYIPRLLACSRTGLRPDNQCSDQNGCTQKPYSPRSIHRTIQPPKTRQEQTTMLKNTAIPSIYVMYSMPGKMFQWTL
jgi:hypothetical protein